MATSALCCSSRLPCSLRRNYSPEILSCRRRNLSSGSLFLINGQERQLGAKLVCYADETPSKSKGDTTTGGIQLYSQIERYTETSLRSADYLFLAFSPITLLIVDYLTSVSRHLKLSFLMDFSISVFLCGHIISYFLAA